MPQDRKPLPQQTAQKAWAAAFGALAANVVILPLAYAGIVTTAETYGLLVTPFTPLGAGLAAYAKRNWVGVLGGVSCHPLAVALSSALLLAG